MPLFGAHMSIAGGYHNALLAAQSRGCATVQLFTKAPNQWAGKPITPEEAREFRRALRRTKLRRPTAHDDHWIHRCLPSRYSRVRGRTPERGKVNTGDDVTVRVQPRPGQPVRWRSI